MASIELPFFRWSSWINSILRSVCFVSLIFLALNRANAANYTVNNASDFNNLPRLNAGDVVQVNSGTYGAINKTLESSIADDATAKSSPILVYAVTPGGAVINAPSKIILSGRGITLAGLDFNANSGIMTGSSYILATAQSSRYMKFSNIRFNGCAAGATYGNWIYLQGFYHTVEFCSFQERPDTIPAPIISIMPNISEGDVTVPRLHRISYCYFGPRYVGTVNGFETIRIGVGDAQTFDMQVTMEHNLFYRSIWRTDLSSGGEPEIISNKTKNNKILYNTFLESQGGICLRSGDGATVEGNFIFGAGTLSGTNITLGTTLASQNGIRVIGQNHVIRNNYIENITGTDIHAALCVMSGESDYYPGNPATGATNSGSYAPAHNAQIYNNTFVNCYEINLGFLSTDSYTNSSGVYVAKSPTNVLFYNNAWQGNGRAASALTRETSNVTGYTPIVLGGSGGNYFYETSTSKFGWTNGVSNSLFSAVTNAGVSSNFDNYKVPTSTSPLLDKASNTLVAAYDVRGLARPTTNQDIGSFERSVTGSGYKPLIRTNVGAGFDGGPTNSYPTPGTGDSVPTILTASLPGGALTLAYSQTLLASGGDGALTWSITSGSLPAGLTILPGTGLISGTPTQSGTFTFTVRVTDSDLVGADYAEKSLSINVSASTSIKLTISTSKAFSSSGGTKPADSYDAKTSTRWSSSVKSSNPNTNGTVYGTDVTAVIYDLGENKNLNSIKLNWYSGSSRTDNYRVDSATNTNVWTTNAWTVTNWSTILPRTNSQLTNGYETVNFTNGASGRYVRLVSWGNSSGNGFTGLNEVEIYGSTYVAPDTRQTQTIIFGALDSALQSDPPIALAAYSLNSSNVSTGLPISYESTDPDVATVDGSTVTITGSGSTWITATQAGDTNYQAASPVQQLLTVQSVSPGITSSGSASAVQGLPFRYQITAIRSPTSYGASNLPAGLSVDTVTGKISGTPTTNGLFAVTLSAQNSAGTGTSTLSLNVIAPYVYDTFESYTNGQAVPLVSSSSPSGIKASGQITNISGNSLIGGTNGKVAWFNDSGGASAQLEFNAGASGQSYLAASFELYNNATPSSAGTMPLNISLAAWNSGNTTAGGSSSNRIVALEFNQFGSLSTPVYSIKGGVTNNFTYIMANKQTVHLFANDHDSNSINYVGPDGNVRTLATNSFAVFLNSNFVGMYGNYLSAVDKNNVLLTGNTNLGRLCFNTTSANTGNWLIDNVVVSDLPTDVAIPAPAVPLITSPISTNGQAGFAFSYQPTTTELADSFICDGALPANISFNTSTGLISGTPNQSGVFPITLYAVNSAGSGSLDVTLTIAPAPPNIFSGANSSLNAGAWTLGAPTASSAGGSYTDLVFSSDATNLTTSSGNINGKSWNVTNGSNYFLSSVRDTNSTGGTTYKMGNTGTNDTSPFTNVLTGVENEMAFLTNNSSLTLSPQSISNNIPATLQLRNSGIMRIATGCTLNLPCNVLQTSASSAYAITKQGGGKLVLSGSNSYTGATTVEQGTLALSGSGTSPTTIKSGAVLELALSNSASVLGVGLTLELGSQVRIIGTPASGQTYTLATASALTNNATLETSISGYQMVATNNNLILQPITVATPSITSSLTATGTVGSSFSYQITASGSPTGYGATGLPAGLSLNATTGAISGTPTVAGTSNVTITATNAGGTGSATLVITVNPAPPAITSVLTASGTVGSAFSYQITASSSPTSYGATGLPAGLSINTGTGAITGTPSAAGTSSVTISASNAGGTGTATLALTIANPGAPVITSTNSASSTVGSAFSYQITASNNPTSFGASNLPSGLSINTNNGLISGTPSVAGTNVITLLASNAGGTGTKNLTLSIGSDYFTLVRTRWSNSLVSNGLAVSSASSISSKAYGFWKTNAATLNTNATSSSPGLWSDLPLKYPSAVNNAITASGNMVTTFSRLEKMAQAWATPGCSVAVVTGGVTNTVTLTGNTELVTAIVNALDWMVANNYTASATQYGNWFDWEVQGAQNFVDTQTLIYSQLTSTQIANYAAAVDNYGPNSANNRDYFSWGPLTGANTTSVALVATIRGALAREADKIAEINGPSAVPDVFPPVTDGDGFYEDGSYIFHYNVAYNGHYGYVMLEGVTTLTALLDGTPWTIVDSNYPYVYDWITNGFIPFYYHGSFMDCVRGRSVGTSGETGPDVGAEILGYINIVANATTTPADKKLVFSNFVANPHPATGQYHYYNMDRVVAHRANYSLALSMSSTRVNNYEDLFGDANTKGYFQGDGMTYLYVGSADTQFVNGYWPSVDIYHLTGTTTEQGTISTPSTTDQSFVGGAEVQDASGFPAYGAAAFSLHPALKSGSSTLYGKKSYFMFKDEVICLGAGITAGSTNEIHTTVENRAMGTASSTATLWVNGASTSRTLGSSVVLTNLTNCAIEGVGGYHFFDNPGNLQAAFQQSSGTWGAIHPGDSDTATYTNNYLKLYYRHGSKPTNATYAYALLPAMSPAAVAGYGRNPQTTILSNTTSVQAAKNAVLGAVGANFWSASGGTADLITANKACSVMTYESTDRISVGVSDPSQTLSGPNGTITVTLDRAATGTIDTDAGVTVVRTTPTIQLQANVAGLHGATLHATFSLAAAPVITGSLNLVGVTGSPVSYQITSDTSGATYGAGGLPPGLSLYGSGLIYGTPTASGTYTATISATNAAGRTGYATLTIQVADSLSSIATTYGSTTTWVCPANVTAVQVEAWGAGGAGGSASRTGGTGTVQYGGGGAGGTYAKTTNIPVIPGSTYYINIGTCSSNSSAVTSNSVAGGDSWFNSNNVPSTLVLAKGGAGGNSAVGNTTATAYAAAGSGTTNGGIGNVLYAGGSGANGLSGFAGGGGSGAASTTNGVAATNNVGAVSAAGGGAGGTGVTSGSLPGGNGAAPGGGGAGARNSSGTVSLGGAGGAGQVIITIKALAAAANPPTNTITFSSLFGGMNPTNVGSDGLAYLVKYAMGGSNVNDKVTLPTVNQNGTSLTMTAIVRTNDTNLTIVGQTVTDLSNTWANLSSNPYGTVSTNTNNVPAGCQRREFTVNSGTNNRTFLRLKATQNP